LSTFLFLCSAPPLTVSTWCWSWTISLFFPAPHSPFSSSSSALPCLHCSREQWRHGSAEEEGKKRAPLVTRRRKNETCAFGYWKKKKKHAQEVQLRASGYCAVTHFAKKKAAPSCFFSPCIVNTITMGPCIVNPICFFAKQLKYAIYTAATASTNAIYSSVNKRYLPLLSFYYNVN